MNRDNAGLLGGVGIGCGVIVLILLVFSLLFSVKFVGAGQIGVATNFGRVDEVEKGPGVNLVIPFFTDVISVDGRVQGIPFENLAAASREYQDVFLTGTLNVHVQFDKAAELYQTVGLDYETKLVIPFYTNIVKEVVPQYAIGEVLPKREEIRRQTVEKLAAKLAPYGIIVDDVALANINFNEAYNQAIQEKQIQELRVQTEKNILEQKKIQAQQAQAAAKGEADAQIEKSKGDAESRVIRSKGNAEAALIEAEAQAEANRKLAESLTAELLQSQYIQKLSDNVNVMMVPSEGNFLFDTRGIFGPQPQ